MTQQTSRHSSNTWVGVLLVIFGLLFLLESLHILNFGHVISHWWPMIFILIGFNKLKGQNKSGGAIIFLLGIVFLSATLDIINWGSLFRFWPLVLIVMGISLILKSKNLRIGGPAKTGETSEDFHKATAIFGGIERSVISENFKGGDILVLFGGIDLDLRQTQVSPDGCHLNLTALFGGIDVIVPPDWQVAVTGTPIFGGIDNSSSGQNIKTEGSRVSCHCTVAFGGIEIKN